MSTTEMSIRLYMNYENGMLVYVPNAVPDGSGIANLTPLGDAGNSARPHLEAGGPHFRKHKHRCP